MNLSFLAKIRSASLALTILLFGCTHNTMQIVAENKSGEELEHVKVLGDGKTYEFGVLPVEGLKGYLSAEMLFGDEFPSKLQLEFETEKGELITTAVAFEPDSEGLNRLHMTINEQYKVSGNWEKIPGQ